MRYTDPSGHTICLDGEQCYTGSGTKPGGGSSGSAGRGKEMGDDYQENGDSNNTAPSNNGLDIEISNSIYTPILNSNDYPNLDENIIYDYSVFPPKPIGIKYTSWTSVHINPDAQVNALNNFTTSVAVEYILTKVSAPSGVGVLIGAIMTINDITYTEQHMGSKEVYFYHLIEFELPRIDIETGRPLPLITSNFFPSVTR